MDRLTKAQMEFMNGYVPANIHDVYEYAAGGGIHIKDSKKGTFTAAATKHGKSVQAFASQVLANKDNYSPAMVKKANFAKNASKWNHQEGGTATGQNDQVMQMIQTYAQMVAQQSGDDPNKVYQELMGQLQQMKPDQQKQAIQEIVSQVQGASQQPAMQMGGDPSQMQQQSGDAEQLIQQIQQMLEQGAEPQEVIAQLLQSQIDPQMVVEIFVQLGMPQEQVVQAVQSVMQEMGSGQEQEVLQEQMQEQSMEEPMQESMAYGGVAKYPYGGMYADKKYYGDFLPQDAFNNAMTDINMLAVPAATMAASGVKALRPVAGIMGAAGALAGSIQGYRGLFNKDAAATPKNPITDAQATYVYDTYGKPNTDPWASKMMDKYMNPNKDPWASKMQKKYMQDGGTPNNPGFNALPKYVQDKILDNMQTGGPYKIKDEREGIMQTKDSMSDRNVFSQNQMSLKKPVVQKEIKQVQKQAKNPKVVVFAESPKNMPTYSIWSDNIPAQLKSIKEEYLDVEAKLDSVRMSDKGYKDLVKKSEKLWNLVSDLNDKYGENDQRVIQAINNARIIDTGIYEYADNNTNFRKKITPYENKAMSLLGKFDANKFNPKVIDSTFYKEAKNVENFYKKTNPNVKVDIVPLYGDEKMMQQKLKNMSEFDKVAIFGHSGGMLAGIPNNDIAKHLSNSRVKDCYFGSCGFESYIENSDFKDIKDKTLNYRPIGNAWLGFNPNAKTFDEGMWSRNLPEQEYDEDIEGIGKAEITPLKKGKTHITTKLKYGGLPQAQFGIPGSFDFNNPFGMQSPRFGQTANYADTVGYPQNKSRIDYNKLNNFSIGPGINDNASLSYGDPYAADGVNRQVPKQTAMTPVSTYGTGVTPYTKTNAPKTNDKVARNVSGRQMANNALLGLSIANYALGEDGPRPISARAVNQQREASMLNNPLNYAGIYTTNVQGGGNDYIPNRYAAIQDYGTTGNVIAKTGGQMNFAAGGQYKVSHDQLLQLLRDGAEIEFL